MNPVPEPSPLTQAWTPEQAPRTNPFSNAINSKKYFIFIVAVGVLIGGIGMLVRMVRQQPVQESLRETPQPTVSPLLSQKPPNNTFKTYDVPEFFLLISGVIQRSETGYTASLDFTPMLIDTPQEKTQRLAHVQSQKSTETWYKVETVSTTGVREHMYTTAGYCPPGTDVCEIIADKEIPVGASGSFDPVSIFITPDVAQLHVSIHGKVIQSLFRPTHAPEIVQLTKTQSPQIFNNQKEGGIDIQWKLAEEGGKHAYSLLEYSADTNKWEVLWIGPDTSYPNYRKYTINPSSIRSTLESIDVRLVVTDGFYATVWREPAVITLTEKELPLFVEGMGEQYSLGQTAFVDVDFVDPETGQGCDGSGCDRGANAGKYTVTWTSDKQTICQSDIARGTLQYKFKKGGVHTLTLKVQHRDKPKIAATRTFTVSTNSDVDLMETQPNDCSFP